MEPPARTEENADCLGCRTARGDFAAEEVYRDERVVAVVALHAINPGHLVVVTREHVRNALTMEADLLCHMMLVARTLGRRLREQLQCPGIMLVFNNEEPCQSLFHAHLHVVPRYHGDEMDVKYGSAPERFEREAMAARLRPVLAAPLD
jgi:histidine triad (HIT) family protein